MTTIKCFENCDKTGQLFKICDCRYAHIECIAQHQSSNMCEVRRWCGFCNKHITIDNALVHFWREKLDSSSSLDKNESDTSNSSNSSPDAKDDSNSSDSSPDASSSCESASPNEEPYITINSKK